MVMKDGDGFTGRRSSPARITNSHHQYSSPVSITRGNRRSRVYDRRLSAAHPE
jgi:hypothetical protein